MLLSLSKDKVPCINKYMDNSHTHAHTPHTHINGSLILKLCQLTARDKKLANLLQK